MFLSNHATDALKLASASIQRELRLKKTLARLSAKEECLVIHSELVALRAQAVSTTEQVVSLTQLLERYLIDAGSMSIDDAIGRKTPLREAFTIRPPRLQFSQQNPSWRNIQSLHSAHLLLMQD